MDGVKGRLLEALWRASGEAVTVEDLKESPKADYGSPIAFRLAKKLGRSPQDIAKEIHVKLMAGSDELVERVEVDGGYINFFLDFGLAGKVLFGAGLEPQSGRGKIVLEHTSVNPTGPVHVGRIRNTIIGDCLRRILSYSGYDVETHYYVNDVGKQVAIIASAFREGLAADPELERKYAAYAGRQDYEVFFTYVGANRLFEEDAGFQARVQKLIQEAESGNAKSLEDITSAAKSCLGGQLESFKRLNVSFDVFDYESEGLRDGSVDGVLERIRGSPNYVKSEVGEGLDLSGFGLDKRGGMSVLARADGTSVYLARDLAYHMKKLALGGRIINVLGEDHKLEFQELKTILKEVFNVSSPIDVVHFSFVSFEGMKFSTRKGEIAAVDELLDEAVAKAQAEVEKRKIGDEQTASEIGVGAVKFHIVKTTPNKQIMFRWEDALNFEGETAPYIQYAHARSCRILEKAGVALDGALEVDWKITEAEEKKLILKLTQFRDVVEAASSQLRPDMVAAYLLELTAAYGRFYMKCPVLDSAEPVRNRRLLIVRRLRDTVRVGLDLLGIDAPQRM